MKLQLFKIRLEEKFLLQDQHDLDEFLSRNEVYKVETAFVQTKEPYWSVIIFVNSETKMMLNENDNLTYSEEVISESEEKILEALKLWRSEKSKVQKIPTYCIATNKELLVVAKSKPHKKEELKLIKGFGKHKIENYGDEIIQLVENF